ncbi:MAG: pyruvate kinase [Bacilli bacterium]
MKKTKIVCTIGPSSCSYDVLRHLIEEGMNVARFNLSHATHTFCHDTILKIRELESELGQVVGILFDTAGPIIRLGEMSEQQVFLKQNSEVILSGNICLGTSLKFSVNYKEIATDINLGSSIILSDGKVKLQVIKKDIEACEVKCLVIDEGFIYSNRTVHIESINYSLPYVSKKDKEDVTFAVKEHVDFLALSYVRNRFDVLDITDLLIELGDEHIAIISKIENEDAVNNVDDILNISDGIMVARGDLGVEMPLEKLPGIQKQLLTKARLVNKVGIVATQMLGTMENDNQPTRAEVSDVYNAVVDGTDAVMLSGETTIGSFPVETVSIMERIVASAEEELDYYALLDEAISNELQDMTTAIAYSVVDSAVRLNTSAIVASTTTGYTAKKISRFRPICPIIATSPCLDTVKSLTLHFGVYPVLVHELYATDDIVLSCKDEARKIMDFTSGDNIIITGGFPASYHNTNFMKIEIM